MQSLLRVALVGAVALAVQRTVMVETWVFGVHPDALLLFALCVAVTAGPDKGAIAGFIAGLCSDAFLTSAFGASALCYAVAAFVVGTLALDAADSAVASAPLVAIGSVIGVVGYLVVGAVVKSGSVSLGRAIGVTFVVALVNALLAPLVCWFMRKTSSPRRVSVQW